MRRCLGLVCVSAILVASASGEADGTLPAEKSAVETDGSHDVDRTKKRAKPVPGFTPEREAAAIEFVRRHHPELAALLARLEKADRAAYRRAIGALFRASERLAHVQERDPKRYERELEAWKLRSRIQLLVARIRTAPEDGGARRELKQALLDQLDLRSKQLAEERKKLQERLKKVDAQLKAVQNDRQAQVEKQIELLLRGKKRSVFKDKGGRGKRRSESGPADGAPPRPRSP